MSYQTLTLGEAGMDLVLSSLREGGLTLAKLVLGKVDLARGEVFTHLPENVDPHAVLTFDQGGIISDWGPHQHLEEIVNSRFAGRNLVFIGEDAIRECNDPTIRQNPKDLFCYGKEVYHWTWGGPEKAPDIRSTIREADTALWVLNCFASSLPAGGDPRFLLRDCTLATLEALAERTELIVTGAYDGEGLVIWRKEVGVETRRR